MAAIQVTGLREEEKELYEQRADQQDCSLSQWGRRAFRVSGNLWGPEGEFDRRKFDRFFTADDNTPESNKKQSRQDNHELSGAILRELSKDEPIDFDEVLDLAVKPLVTRTLNDLQETERVKYRSQEGYIKDA